METEYYIDQHSSTWRFIEQWASERINQLHERNSKPKYDHDETMLMRGKLKMLAELKGLVKNGHA